MRKICTKCKVEKPLECFSKWKYGKDGLKQQCKECLNQDGKRYNEEHKEENAEKHKKYYDKNNKEIKEKAKKYRKEHPEKSSICNKKWYEENREHKLEKNKEWYKNNPEKRKKIGRRQREKKYRFLRAQRIEKFDIYNGGLFSFLSKRNFDTIGNIISFEYYNPLFGEEIKNENKDYKKCRACGKEKLHYEFSMHNHGKGLIIEEAICKNCQMKERKTLYDIKKLSIIKVPKIRKIKTAEETNARKRNNRNKNLEKYKKRERVYSRNRRALKKSIKEDFRYEDLVKELFDHKCFNCGYEKHLTLDHHYPLSKKNPLTINNCVLLCRGCNSKKWAKDPEVFYTQDQLEKIQEIFKKAEEIVRKLETK